MAEIFEKKKTRKSFYFSTLDFKNLKSCFKLAQISLETIFHETGTFGGFGKRAQSASDIHF